MAKKHKNKKRFIPQGILTRETASNSPALGSMQQRTISFEAREINETERTVHVSFSSEAVVPRFWGTEVLCHDKDCVDLTRLTELGVSLFNHNRDKVIGVIKNPILNEVEKRCHCDIYFDDDEDSDKIFQKVKKGILRGVSVGYQVDRWEEVKTGEVSSNGRFKGPCFVATKWTPLEVSIVSVPADTDVGVNRTIEEVNKEIVQRTERREIMDLKELCRSLGIDYDKLIAQGLNDDAIRALCSSIQQKREADEKEDEKKKSDEKAKADKKAEEEKNEKEKRAAEIASETQRSVEISTLCRDFGEDAIPYIKEGKSVEEVRSAILAKVKAERAALPGNVQIVDSEREKIRAAAVDGLLLRSGVNIEKPADGANNFRGMKMRDLAIECLEREGVSNAHRLNDDDLFRRAVSPDSQFTSILDNTVKKSMATAYKAAEPTYDKWCGKGSNSDFKEAAHYQLSEGGDLIQLSQSGEIKFDEMTDNKVTKKVLTYARGFGFTRQALINDDLSVLTKVPAAYVRAAMRGRNKLVYKLLGSNAAIYDGKALFHADHKNKGTAGALSTQTLSELIKLMRKQKNIRGKETLNIKPEFLIVPAALEATAAQLLVSTADPAANNSGVANIYRNSMNLIVDAELDDYSETQYYVAANPADIDTIEVTYLNGNEQPILESQVGFDFVGIKWRILDDFGVTALDYRGLATNAGA
nr:MAG TPA: major capsid protein [Bacteriophage sp.]